MSRTDPAAWLLAGLYLTAGGFLTYTATVAASGYAAVFYGAALLAAAAAYSSATATRRPPAATRPGTEREDRRYL
ncbi:hypothetical protein [Streptomyces alfalfae]